jgi:nucleoside-diphosphate-sugar epimerase
MVSGQLEYIVSLAGGALVKAIITGGSGFIVPNLVERFLDMGWEVLKNLWRRVDPLDREAMIEVFRSYKPDVVLHMAARTDLHESRSIKGYAANTEGIVNDH